MIKKRSQGIITPKRNANIPARVININSGNKKAIQSKIRLDKLLRSEKPVVCIKRRLGGIGDVLMTTPVLESIKKLIPHCQLIYATDLKYSQGALGHVIQHNPYVNTLISFSEVDDTKYDYSVDLTVTGLKEERSGSLPPNRIDMFAEAVGISIDQNPVPTYIVTGYERERAKQQIKENVLKDKKREDVKIIAVQARSNDSRRTWPLDSVEKLINKLSETENIKVIIFDWGKTVDRWKTTENIWAVLDRELPEVAALVEQVDLVICPDSAMLHLAGALDKKTLSVFGPIPPECRINHYGNTSAVSLNLSCHPCWYTPKCARANSHLECLTKITPEIVYEAAINKMNEPTNVNCSIRYGKDISKGSQDNIILVARSTSGIGDMLMAMNGIEALKTKFPNKEIHVACRKEIHPAIQGNKNISNIINVENAINYKRYYMIIDISTPCARYESTRIMSRRKVEKSRVEVFAEALGTRNLIPDILPRYYITREEKKEAKLFIEEAGLRNPGKPKLGIALSSEELYRDWPKEYYGVLINLLKDSYNIITIHKDRNLFFDGIIDACGLPFRKAMSILGECDGLVTIDTGVLHVAAALKIPTIALFGPIDYKARCKGYQNTTVIVSDLDCIPCWRNGNTKCKQTGLVKAHSKCMESISPNNIAKIVRKKIGVKK